jgi:hypothetical protein
MRSFKEGQELKESEVVGGDGDGGGGSEYFAEDIFSQSETKIETILSVLANCLSHFRCASSVVSSVQPPLISLELILRSSHSVIM